MWQSTISCCGVTNRDQREPLERVMLLALERLTMAMATYPSAMLRLCPQQYAVDNQRIINEQQMDDLGSTKPTKKERTKASIVNAIDRRDYAEARRLQDQIEGMQEHERRVRGAKKALAKMIEKCRAQMNERALTPDPNSGDEGGHSNQ